MNNLVFRNNLKYLQLNLDINDIKLVHLKNNIKVFLNIFLLNSDK